MKKLICAAAAAALVIPGAAMADHIPGGSGPGGVVATDNPDGFKNRGQCQSALSREINRQRKDPDARTPGWLNTKASDFQHAMQQRFACDYFDDFGAWQVYVADHSVTPPA